MERQRILEARGLHRTRVIRGMPREPNRRSEENLKADRRRDAKNERRKRNDAKTMIEIFFLHKANPCVDSRGQKGARPKGRRQPRSYRPGQRLQTGSRKPPKRAGEGSTNQNIPEIYDRPIRTHDIGLAATPQASGLDRAAGTWGADQCKTEINFSCFENVTKSKSQESVARN